MDTTASLEQLFVETVSASTEASSVTQPPTHAPTMGRLAKLSYTHDALIDLVIAQPGMTQNQLAAVFGYSPPWISNIMASDAFQSKLAARREQVVDPTLRATVEERLRGLVIQSIERIQQKLAAPVVSDTVALRALELGAKGLGLGGHAPPAPVPIDLDRLAERLIQLNPNRERLVEGEVLSKEIASG